jgi:hypothetical protein
MRRIGVAVLVAISIRAQAERAPSRADLMARMRSFDAALGVKCEYCHLARDSAGANPNMVIARKMVAMVREINANFPDGKTHVTCYTCHRGAQQPAMTPPE